MSAPIALAPMQRIAARAGHLSTALRQALGRFEQAVEVMASRRDLAAMDDRMLQDLGISRAQAEFEATRAPWLVTSRSDMRR